MKYYQKWSGKICDKGYDNGNFSASVPGNIQYDYGEAHNFGNPDYMDNYQKYLPYENVTWEYSTKLQYTANEGERVYFVSYGIDYIYDILINGEKIYSYEGMYKPVSLDITDKIKGNDVLSVIIHPHPKLEGAAVDTRNEASACCKPPFCYGWDWNPRLLISGMWQEAFIETRGEGFVKCCEPFVSLNDDMTKGTVEFKVECDGDYTITVSSPNGKTFDVINNALNVDNPLLWWCNGQGEPNLYSYTVKGSENEIKGTFGFKRLRLVRNTWANDPNGFPKSRYDAPITIELNGRRIFAKGSNWVNAELFLGRTTEQRYNELLTLVKDANMNMLRIWGGSGINKDVFYDICDRMGIMVWQEFMLACNKYPDTKEYLSVLESEATAVIRQLRHHASLAIWCGGNELFNGWSGMDDQSLPLRLLDRLCYQHDSGRPFLKTSPIIGMAHGGYTFTYPESSCDIFHAMKTSKHTAYTEFGVPSITDIETIKNIIPEDEIFPILPTKAWVDRHGLKSWGDDTWACQKTIDRYFGKGNSIEYYIEKSEELQSAGYQAAFEAIRRQWPHASMALNWCFDEPWSNAANNCIIGYPAKPRKAYYAVKKALRPTIFSAGIDRYDWTEWQTFSADLWLVNDSTEKVSGKVTASIITSEGETKLLDWDAEANALENREGPTIRCVLPKSEGDSFILKLSAENGMENEYKLILRHLPRPKSKKTAKKMNA